MTLYFNNKYSGIESLRPTFPMIKNFTLAKKLVQF